MSFLLSCTIVVLSLLTEVFILSGLPVFNVTMPLTMILLVLLLHQLDFYGALLGVLIAGFIGDAWTSVVPSAFLVSWIVAVCALWLWRTVARSYEFRLVPLQLLMALTVFQATSLLFQPQVPLSVWASYLFSLGVVAVFVQYIIQRLSAQLGRVI